MKLVEDQALVGLHRAADLAGRPGITIPSQDLNLVDDQTGSRARSHKALRRLVEAGKVIPVRRDLSVLPGATGLVDVDLLQLVEATAPHPHLITGGRALELRNLTDQHYFKVAVLSPRSVAPIEWRSETALFFKVTKQRIWGGKPLGEQGTSVPVATAERAILDSLSHPRYGVSAYEAARALRTALDEPDFTKRLARAVSRYKVAAVARRAGLLVEHLAGREVARPFEALIGKSPTPVLFRPGGAHQGPVDHRWRVKLNIDLDRLLDLSGQ